jgi:signal transduction histidine kinase/ligand-binding sensor domain-containing protein
MKPMRNLSNLLFAASLAALSLSSAAAAEPVIAAPPPIAMHHTSWTAKDGVTGFILDMAQTRDGLLWLASPTGLLRFDGVRLERFAPGPDGLPSSNISAVTALRSGGLLIGYRLGGASLWKDNVLHNYADAQGLLPSTVWSLTEDADGRIWAGTVRALYFMDGTERWQTVPASWEPPHNITGGLLDQRGTLWLRTPEGTWYLPRGEKKFHRHARPLNRGPLVMSPDGSVWTSEYSDPQGKMILLAAPPSGAAPAWAEGTPTGGVFQFDRGGGLWRGANGGVEHVSGPPDRRIVERLTPMQGYSGESTESMLQDREGNIWTGTHNGLDRFRPNKLQVLALPKFHGEARAIALNGAGDLWINRMVLPPPYTASLMESPVPTAQEQAIACLYTDPDGVVWLSDRGELSRHVGGAWESLPLAPEAQSGGAIYAIAREPKGALWVSVRSKGIYRWQDGQWYKDAPGPDAPKGVPLVITADNVGRVWFGYAHHQISLLENGKLRNFNDDSGLRLGAVLAITSTGKHVWAGGEKGVAYYNGKRFVPLRTTEDGALNGASGIVETANGDLWVHGALGIAHIGAAELETYFNDPLHKTRFERFDSQDGLAGSAAQLAPRPSMISGADGRLWFSTSSSVYWIDPAHIARNNLPPPVMIGAMLAENARLPPRAGMALPAGTRDLRIDYTATSLTMPERMRFAYRLDGVDRDWKSGEQQRSAHYTNLEPGDYRFVVKASNNDGVWNEAGAELPFRIEPTLTQTPWFRLLCGAAGAALLWLMYRLRLRQVARHIHARLDERIVERERIARELHDTLLQAVQGLILHIQAAVLRAPRQEPLRVQVETALQQADDILIEGRERVSGLRASACGAQDLAARLSDMAATLTAGACAGPGTGGMRAEVRQTGTPRGLHPIASEEILAIARQALVNAVRHSQASEIVIDLHYGARELRLTIGDNGVGMPSEVMAQGARSGHWGLPGMRERADNIKARLGVQSAAGAGVQWTLALSAELAYQPTAPRGFWRWTSAMAD